MKEVILFIVMTYNHGMTSQQIEFKPMAEQTAMQHCEDVKKLTLAALAKDGWGDNYVTATCLER